MSINETVRLITSARDGDQAAQAELFSRLHVALMNIAKAERYRWQGNLTMNATAVLNEAYIKLTEGQALAFNDRAHFLAIAGKAMRQVLQDYAKSKETHKRGGEIQKSLFKMPRRPRPTWIPPNYWTSPAHCSI